MFRTWNDLHARFMKIRADARKNMSADQKRAVDTYHNLHEPGAGMKLNRELRCSRPCDLARTLDGVFMDAPVLPTAIGLPHLILYRGISGVGGNRLKRRWTEIGSTHTFKSFVSTSFVPLSSLIYAGSKGVVLRMHLRARPPGTQLPHVYAPRETEVTLPRNTKWRLTASDPVVPTRDTFAASPAQWHPFEKETDFLTIGVVPHNVHVLDIEPVFL